MKAIVIHEPGGPEKLCYEEVPTPVVRAGWSLVRVRGFGINHSEIFTRKGLSPGVSFPRILGIECVGEIAETTDPLRLLKGRRPELHVSGSTRSMKKEAQLREAGFDQAILDADGILQTDRQFDRVLELIGPATLRDTFSHVVEGGIVCSTGQLGGQWTLNDFDPIFELPANGYLTSFYSGNVDPARLQSLLDYVRTYGIDPAPERVFSLSQVPEAHAYLESAGSFGKVIVLI